MSGPAERLEAVVARTPYARFLGVQFAVAGDEMTGVLPFAPHLVGNPLIPALHGGVIGAFMEMTALAQLALTTQGAGDAALTLARPIGVTVEYLRPGRPVETFARAAIRRQGRRIASVTVEAWQDRRSAPIAVLSGRFLASAPDDG